MLLIDDSSMIKKAVLTFLRKTSNPYRGRTLYIHVHATICLTKECLKKGLTVTLAWLHRICASLFKSLN